MVLTVPYLSRVGTPVNFSVFLKSLFWSFQLKREKTCKGEKEFQPKIMVSNAEFRNILEKTLTKIFLQLDSKWRQSLQKDESVLLSPQAQLQKNKHQTKQFNMKTNIKTVRSSRVTICVPIMVLNGGLQHKVASPNILIKSNKKTLAVFSYGELY